jgi:hypothetical protein
VIHVVAEVKRALVVVVVVVVASHAESHVRRSTKRSLSSNSSKLIQKDGL